MWHRVDLPSARNATTAQENPAVHAMAQKIPRQRQKQLPRRHVLKHQEYANLGAQATPKAGRRNARGRNVLDVLNVLQGGFEEVTLCFCDGTVHIDC